MCQAGLLGKVVTSLAPEVKLTAGYTDTTSQGNNAGVSLQIPTGQHGTATKGTLTHHSYGHWIIRSGTVPGGGKLNGCKTLQISAPPMLTNACTGHACPLVAHQTSPAPDLP